MKSETKKESFVQIDNQLIVKGFEENPEISLVLEIATRARELEERELHDELVSSNSVAVGTAHQQLALV